MPAAIAIPAIMGAVGVGTSVAQGVIGSNAAKNASKAQVASSNNAIDQEQSARNYALGVQNGAYNQELGNIEPYIQTGAAALNQLGQGTQPGGEFNSTPTGAQVLAQDPGYDFRLQQGQLALERAEAAGGGVGSGGALKAATQYGQDYASGEYNSAFNRFLQNRQANYSNLANLAGLGQTGNAQALNAGENYANESTAAGLNSAAAIGNLMTGAGNAQASGYMGSANAWSGTLGSIGNIAQSVIGRIPTGSSYTPNPGMGANLPLALGPQRSLGDLSLG